MYRGAVAFAERIIRHDPTRGVVLALAYVFFIVTGLLAQTIAASPNSPDEMVNRAFALQLGSYEGWLRIPASDVALKYDLTPRATTLIGGGYAPAAFWGLPLIYGFIVMIPGAWLLSLLTPLVVAIAGLAFFGLLWHVWGQRVGFIATLLYFLHPAVWYYSVRGLYPNALFTSLFILSLYACIVQPIQKRKWLEAHPWLQLIADDVLAGLALFAAVLVRPAEIVWVAVVFLLMAMSARPIERLRLKTWGFFLLFVLLCFAIASSLGLPLLRGGYVTDSGTSIFSTLFPFGVHPFTALSSIWRHTIALQGFVVLASVVGFAFVLYRLYREKKGERRSEELSFAARWYTAIIACVAWYPLLLYGSWAITDNPTPWLATIGSSYVRYWLPLFVLALPFAAYVFIAVFDWAKKMHARYARYVWIGFFLFWFVQSATALVFGADGLRQEIQQARFAQRVKEDVLAQVPENAVLVVDRWDKVFWPQRTVARGLFDEGTQKKIADMLSREWYGEPKISVYYFGLRMTLKEEEELFGSQAIISVLQKIYDDHALYALSLPPHP